MYTSTDENIVSVNSSGKITRLAVGNASMIISNGDKQESVTIIIKKQYLGNKGQETSRNGTSEMGEVIEKPIDSIVLAFTESNIDKVIINKSESSVVSKECSKFIQNNNENLPAKILLTIDEKIIREGRYLYLYNKSLNFPTSKSGHKP